MKTKQNGQLKNQKIANRIKPFNENNCLTTRTLERLENMSTRLKIGANNQGDMFLKVKTDEIEVKMSFKNVETVECGEYLTNSSKEMKEVTVDIKKFISILQSSFEPTLVICNIVADRAVQLFLCLEDQSSFSILFPGL